MKKKRPEFFALYKDFNNGRMTKYEVLHVVFNEMFDDKENIDTDKFVLYDHHLKPIPVRTRGQLNEFIKDKLMNRFWANASWEYVAIDWPYMNTIKESRPVKIDVWNQLLINIDVINQLIWDYTKKKINALVKKEKDEHPVS